jgi:hypothetical protein
MSDTVTTPADVFRAMAARIDRNDPAEFAGAILIVPPPSSDGRGGDPIEILLIDPHRDLANFWSTVKSKAQIGADEFVALQQSPPMGWGR